MELIQKFQVVAANGAILKPSCVVVDKAYPIMSAEQTCILYFNVITINIRITTTMTK
jgi:hypothetical protein